jgi:probable HAF family extracellular repeat protein
MGSGFRGLVAALAAGASLAAQALATQWTAVDLTPEGSGHATAVSASGVVVGCRNVGNETRAFVYRNGTRQDLAAPAGATSCATAVNDAGMVAGRINGEITVWQNGAARGLGVKGDVTDINDQGVMVGSVEDGTTSPFGGANTRAFMWSNGAFTDLGAPSGRTYAIGINRRDQVAVFANGQLYMYENGALRDLGANVTNAYGFNDRGEIVGMTSFGHGPQPFIWDGTVREIPGGGSFAGAVGLNNMGQVLGSGEGVYGYVIEDGVAVRTDVLAGAPWSHTEPKAINDRGWIVGQGGNSNDFHAFLLVPKENAPTAASGGGNPLMRYVPGSRPLLMVGRRTQP